MNKEQALFIYFYKMCVSLNVALLFFLFTSFHGMRGAPSPSLGASSNDMHMVLMMMLMNNSWVMYKRGNPPTRPGKTSGISHHYSWENAATSFSFFFPRPCPSQTAREKEMR